MKLVMKDTKFWKSCIGVIADLIEEATFKVTPTGLKMKAMDPSHVALVDFELPSNAFNEFMVDKPITLNINLAEMNKIMARAKLEDELTLEFDSSENRLILTFRGDSTRRFTMSLIDLDETDVPACLLAVPSPGGQLIRWPTWSF